jgi:hypothetical protein
MVEYARVFHKLATLDHGAEGGGVDEVVVDAILLARPACARRRRDAELDLLVVVEQLPRQGGFARP